MTSLNPRNVGQRRAFLESLTVDSVNGELDEIYKILNALYKPITTNIFEDYTVSIFDRFISCKRSGITVTLPLLKEFQDGFVLEVQDQSGEAGSANITILPATGSGMTFNGASSLVINSNYGYKKFRFSFSDNAFYVMI